MFVRFQMFNKKKKKITFENYITYRLQREFYFIFLSDIYIFLLNIHYSMHALIPINNNNNKQNYILLFQI
jgi:hypothetical protein